MAKVIGGRVETYSTEDWGFGKNFEDCVITGLTWGDIMGVHTTDTVKR